MWYTAWGMNSTMTDQMVQTEVDQMANNAINTEANKGVGGVLGDIEGMFGGHQ